MALDVTDFSADDKVKLRHFFEAAMRVYQETDDLKAGLKDSSTTLAEIWGIKPALLMKAARTAYKSSLEADKDQMDTVENLLEVAGRSS